MAKKQIAPDTTFVRSLTAKKESETFTLTAQPYFVGMYVIVNSETQMNIPHTKYKGWTTKLEKTLKSQGYEVTKTVKEYGDFMDERDLDAVNS